jgi:hypothetical protein
MYGNEKKKISGRDSCTRVERFFKNKSKTKNNFKKTTEYDQLSLKGNTFRKGFIKALRVNKMNYPCKEE